MKHPEVLILPILMSANYALVIYGSVLKERGYTKHFKNEGYFVDPGFRAKVEQGKWFSLRFMLFVVMTTACLVIFGEFIDFPAQIFMGMIGALYTFFGVQLGSSLGNTLLFQYFAEHPDEVNGEIEMAQPMILKIGAYRYLLAGVPLLFATVASPSPYLYGALYGILMLYMTQAVAIIKVRRIAERDNSGL